MPGNVLLCFLLACLCLQCTGHFWTESSSSVCYISTEPQPSLDLINSSPISTWVNLKNRVVLGLRLLFLANSVLCFDGSTQVACNQSISLQAFYNGELVAPNPLVNSRIPNESMYYSIAYFTTTSKYVLVATNFSLGSANFDFEFSSVNYNLQGTVCLSLQLLIDEYQPISPPPTCINTASPPTPLMTNDVYTSYITNINLTTFQLSYLSGSISCSSSSPLDPVASSLWGCPSNGFGVFLVSSLDSSSTEWILPDRNEPDVQVSTAPPYWYTLKTQSVDSAQINFKVENVTLDPNVNYSLGFGEQIWKDPNTTTKTNGEVCLSVSASFVKWREITETCFSSAHGYGEVPIDDSLVGKRALAFKFNYINGSVFCNSPDVRPSSYWGCVMLNYGSLFAVSLREGVSNASANSSAVAPMRDDPAIYYLRDLYPSVTNDYSERYGIFEKFVNDSEIIFQSNYTFSTGFKFLYVIYDEVYLNTQLLDNSGATCLTVSVLLDECSINNGGCAQNQLCSFTLFDPTPQCSPNPQLPPYVCLSSCENVGCVNQICRPSVGNCDVAEYCNRQSTQCPPDTHALPDVVCRPSNSSCDIAEVCGIGNGICPPDIVLKLDACGVCGGNGLSCLSNNPVCGDGYCASTESCASCVLDCAKQCVSPHVCASAADCNHGSCQSVSCICDDGWTGVNCDKELQNIIPVFNATAPRVSIRSNESVSFSISYVKIEEVTPSGVLVQSQKLNGVKFNITNRNTDSVTWIEYSAYLTGGSYIIFSFKLYNELTFETFANQSVARFPNTLKSTIQITQWPFNNINNVLRIWPSNQGTLQSNNKRSNGNIEWIQYLLGQTTLFVTFPDSIELDGNARKMQVEISNSNVFLVVPHFWNYVLIDPDFSVLVSNKDPKTGHTSDTKPYIIAGVLIITVVAIIAVVLYYVRKRYLKNRAERFSATLKSRAANQEE